MNNTKRSKILSLAVVILCVAGAYGILPGLQARISREKTKVMERSSLFHTPSPAYIRMFSLGFDEVLADFFWIQAVTYSENDALDKIFKMSDAEAHKHLGSQPVSMRARLRVYQLLNMATELQPGFLEVYEFGGNVLAWSGYSEFANILLKKGYDNNRNNPKAWKIPYSLAFNLYFFDKDKAPKNKPYKTAAEYMLEAARLSKGRFNTTYYAATLMLADRQYNRAANLLKRLYDNETDPGMKKSYEEKIKYFIVEQDLVMLNKALKIYMSWFKVLPTEKYADAALLTKVKPSILRSVPEEPFGGKYVINTKERRVENMPYRRHRIIMDLESGADLKAELEKHKNAAHNHEGGQGDDPDYGHDHGRHGH